MYDTGYIDTIAALLAAYVTIIVIIGFTLLIYYFIGMWKLFTKLGLKGWKSLIPIYREWVLYEAVGLDWYWFIIYIVSLGLLFGGADTSFAIATIGLSLTSVAYIYNISKIFHQSKSWIVLTFLFEPISLPLLGLNNNVMVDKKVQLTPNAMFDDNQPTKKSSTKNTTKEDK